MEKIVIVCNSNNAFFQKYYGSLLENISASNVYFFGNRIFTRVKNGPKVFVSSYTKQAFLDMYTILDFLIAPVLIFRIIIFRIKTIHFVSAHPSNLIIAFFGRIFGRKVVFTIHDLIPHPDKKTRIVNLYNKAVIKWLSTDVLVHNEDYLKQLSNKGHYIPLSGYKENFCLRKLSKRLLFFGRIEPYKGINNLYRLAEHFANQGLDWEIVIAGKGKLPPISEQVQISNNIKIINRFISDDELMELHKGSAFSVLPYDSASQSAVIIHSYAFATPVIVYNVGALGEYVLQNRTGLIVEHNDFQSIIKFLQGITPEKFAQLQNEVSNVFNENYSDEVFAKDTMKLYSNL